MSYRLGGANTRGFEQGDEPLIIAHDPEIVEGANRFGPRSAELTDHGIDLLSKYEESGYLGGRDKQHELETIKQSRARLDALESDGVGGGRNESDGLVAVFVSASGSDSVVDVSVSVAAFTVLAVVLSVSDSVAGDVALVPGVALGWLLCVFPRLPFVVRGVSGVDAFAPVGSSVGSVAAFAVLEVVVVRSDPAVWSSAGVIGSSDSSTKSSGKLPRGQAPRLSRGLPF